MTDERTQGTDFGQRQRVQKATDIQTSQQLQQVQQQGAVVCPNCGAMNAEDAQNCASCGAHLKGAVCPHCGCAIDADADFCEVCHHYIRKDVCSFCGSPLRQEDSFCPECGSPRGGIVCPTCHTLNDFAFCKQCGTPLTDEARLLLAQVKQMPEYQEMVKLAREYDELTMEQPYETERDASRDLAMQQFRERVLRLLAQDNGIASPIIPKVEKMRMSKEELKAKKNEKLEQLAALLEKMQIPSSPSPVHVRNYAMAQKPAGVRLAWVCNWKHAMHSSPCGCAKPQMGGKWVILGKGSKQEIKDDL